MRRAITVAAVALIALTGCGQYAAPYPPAVPPHRGELVGTWVHEDEDSSTGATLRLNDDGTLAVSGVPFEVFTEEGDWTVSTDLRSDTGTWDYDESQTVFDRLEVDVVLDQYDVGSLDFSAAFLGGPTQLVIVIGDPDSGDFYHFDKDF